MNTTTRKVVIILVVAAAVAAALVLKNGEARDRALPAEEARATAADAAAAFPAASGDVPAEPGPAAALPRLVDLGADKCIPCKMMKPILDELKRDYGEGFHVEFIDVWKDPQSGRELGIKVIPTQIFFAADGKELFRHEGFFSKEDILSTWERHGIAVGGDVE